MNPPDLIEFNEYPGWNEYIEVIYTVYCKELKTKYFQFEGKQIALKKYPTYQGKDKAFWHIVTAGEIEDQRNPDLRKCAHIKWIRYVVDNCTNSFIKIWKNNRKGKTNVCLAMDDFSYLVVLGERNGYVILLSAYPTPDPYKKIKLRREYEQYIELNRIRPNGADSSSPSTHGR